MQREKRSFDPSTVITLLKNEASKSKEFQLVYEAYENGMRQMAKQVRGIVCYPTQMEIGQLSKSSSIICGDMNIDEQIDERTETRDRQDSNRLDRSVDRSDKKWKQKAIEYESENNQLRENNERLSAKIVDILSDCEKQKLELQNSINEAGKLRISLAEAEGALTISKAECIQLQGTESAHVEAINGLKDQLAKKIIQLTEIEADRNQLIERYLQEKTAFAEKMNSLNQQQIDMNMKMEKLAEDEQYLMQRKLHLQTEVAKTGVKMPSLAPTIAESKIQLTQTDVPSKVSKTLSKLHRNEIYCVTQTLNGSLVASCGGDNSLKLYDPFSQFIAGTLSSPREDNLFLHAAFAPFNDLLVAALTDKTLQIYNYTTCKLKMTLQGHNDRVNVASFTSEKEKVISGSADRSLKVWDINKASTIKTLICGSIVRSVDYFQSEPHVVTGHNDGSLRIYSTRDQANTKPMTQIPGLFDGGITSVRLSNCQNYLLASSADGFSVKCVDLRVNKLLRSFESNVYFNNHEFNKCCFGPDDKYVIAGCSDSSIFIWNFQNGTQKVILKTPNHQGVIVAVDFHNITGNLYSGDSRGNLVVWN